MSRQYKILIGLIMTITFLTFNLVLNEKEFVNTSFLTDQSTITEVFPNSTEIEIYDSVLFTVHVTSNGDPVPYGTVTLKEVTDGLYEVSGGLINGMVILEWLVQSSTPTGWCTFIATYEGAEGYATSSGTTEVSVGDPVPTGSWGTVTNIIPNVSIAWIDSTVTFSVSITILGSAFPFFSGGYISLVDISENIVLQKQNIISQAAVTYTTDFTVTIPQWYSSGLHLFEARYTGSFEADHTPSMGTCSLQVLVNGYSLSLSTNATTINREDSNLLLSAYIAGDDPLNHLLILKTIQNSTQIVLAETNVTSRDYTYVFSPKFHHQLGMIDFELTLHSPITGDIEAQERISVVIIDSVSILYEFNADEYGTGDLVHLIVYSVETDLPTQPLRANITVSDLSIPLELGTVTTDIYGRAEMEWQVPEGIAGGIHQIEIQAKPFDSYYSATTIITEIIVRTNINFILSYPVSIQRGKQTILNCTVISDSNMINEGHLNLRYQNGTLIWSTEVTGLVHYTYNVGLDHIIGPVSFLWEYEGSAAFHPGNLSMTMKVFSQPYFLSLTPNCTSIVQGKTVRLVGRLVDEIGQGIANADVTLWNNNNLIAIVSTVENGTFIYEYFIPLNTPMGLYIIEARFAGDYSLFRLSASNFGVCTISIRAPLQMIMNDLLIGTETTTIQISGTPFEEVELTWSPLNNTPLPWYTIGSLTLDSDGQGYYLWTIPVFKGNTSLRAINHVGEMIFMDAIIYTRSRVNISNWSDETQVQTNVFFSGEVSEEYRLLLDELIVTPWQVAGAFQKIISFQTRGVHTLTVQTQGEYVLAENFSYHITVFEPLSASMDLPSSVSANNEVTATVTVEGIHEDPINGLSVILTANGTERASTTTTAKGKAILVFSISAGTYNITCATQNHADYYRDVSISQILIVRSTTQLTLSQADLHYYGTCLVSALLKDELGNPVPHKLIDFMISIDQGITWTFLGANMTGDNGQGLISWFNELLPLTSGNYLIKASFAGSFHYEPSLTSIEVEIHRYEVVASWDRFTLVDGETVNYTITASDSNGISNISIIRQNETILVELSDNDTAEGELRFYAPGTYCVQVIITDMAGLMTTTNFTFIVEGKGPKFISVYPSDTILNEMRSPVLLEVEAIVADPSGISQIILHTNSTGYPLTFTNGMWCTSLELSNATYSLWLTAIDIYGVESRYELGQITPFLNKTAIANDEGDGTRNIQSVKEDSASPFLMLGVLTLSLTVLIGNFISKWRRRNYL